MYVYMINKDREMPLVLVPIKANTPGFEVIFRIYIFYTGCR